MVPFCPKCQITPVFSTGLAALTWPQTTSLVQQETHWPWTWHHCAQPGPPSRGSSAGERALKAPDPLLSSKRLLYWETQQAARVVARAPHAPTRWAPTLPPRRCRWAITLRSTQKAKYLTRHHVQGHGISAPNGVERRNKDSGKCRCHLKVVFMSTHDP